MITPVSSPAITAHSLVPLQQLIDRTLEENLIEKVADPVEPPPVEPPKVVENRTLLGKVSAIFHKAITAIKNHPVKTLVGVALTVGLSAGLFYIGTTISIAAAAILLGIVLAIATLKVIQLYRHVQNQEVHRTLAKLELAGLVTPHEAAGIKRALKEPNLRQTVLERQFRKWKEKGVISGEECFELTRILDQRGLRKANQAIRKMAFDEAGEARPRFGVKSIREELQFCINRLEKSSEIKALTNAMQSQNKKAFRTALIRHYREIAAERKKESNLVEFHRNEDFAHKIEKTLPEKVFLTFARQKRHQTLFEWHDRLLNEMVQKMNAIEKLDLDQAQGLKEVEEKLVKLHAISHQLLADYEFVSPEVDELFAFYRGNFAHNYKVLDELLKNLSPDHKPIFCPLPFEPGQHESNQLKAVPPSVYTSIQKKLQEVQDKLAKKDQLEAEEITRLEAQAKSLERSLHDVEIVEQQRDGNSFAEQFSPLHKKTVMIATCSFGTGHKNTKDALIGHIGDKAHVSAIDPTEYNTGIFLHHDWLYKIGKLIGKKWSATKAFEWILKNQKYWMVNLENKIDSILCRIFPKMKNGIAPPAADHENRSKRLLRQRFLMERPDMVITTYHMDLNPFLEVAEELGVPLLHAPTDLDVKMKEVFKNKGPTYAHFKSLLPDNNDDTLESSRPVGVSKLHYELEKSKDGSVEPQVAGIPLRPEFYIERTPEEIAAIKKEKGIDPDAKVILVLSGGNGQALPYPEMLMKAPNNGTKYHMIVVAGGNKAAGDELTSLRKEGQRFITGANPNVTIEVAEDPVKATEKTPYFLGPSELSRLHAISDVAITKPGGLSIAELLQTGVPMIPDRRVTPMAWEDFNIETIAKMQRGQAYTGKENFLELLDTVTALGKKPKVNRSKWLTEQMTKMIAAAEDDTNREMIQRRKYLRGAK